KDSAIDQRHTKKRLIRILPGLAEVFEPRMILYAFNGNRSDFFRDEPRKAFMECQAKHADALLAKPQRCSQNEIRAIWLEQIRGTNIGLKMLRDQRDDIRKRFGGLVGVLCEVRDLIQRENVIDLAPS